MDITKETLLFFQNMKNHFIKRGKKETIENYFRSSLRNRALSKKVNFYGLLSNAMLSSTPFVRLKEKKRRRYTKYKIYPGVMEWSRRKALSSFSQTLKGSDSGRNLFANLEKELLLLKAGTSTIQAKRDEYHKLALRSAPYRWRKLLMQKKKNAK